MDYFLLSKCFLNQEYLMFIFCNALVAITFLFIPSLHSMERAVIDVNNLPVENAVIDVNKLPGHPLIMRAHAILFSHQRTEHDANHEYPSLHHAVDAGDLIAVQKLIETGVSVDEQDVLGNTPLHYAALWEDTSLIARKLIFAGAEVQKANNYNFTPAAVLMERFPLEKSSFLIACWNRYVQEARFEKRVFEDYLASLSDMSLRKKSKFEQQ